MLKVVLEVGDGGMQANTDKVRNLHGDCALLRACQYLIVNKNLQ